MTRIPPIIVALTLLGLFWLFAPPACGQTVSVGVTLPRVSIGVAPVQPVIVQPATYAPQPDPAGIPIGTLYLTRNADERLNRSPGYWNHLCVYVGNGQIIESMEGIGVRRVPLVDLWQRGYSEIVLMRPRDWLYGSIAARRAEWLVGRHYAPYSSLWPVYGPLRMRLGLNCVSTGEIAYGVSGLNKPDDTLALQYSYLFPPEWAQPPQYAQQTLPPAPQALLDQQAQFRRDDEMQNRFRNEQLVDGRRRAKEYAASLAGGPR